MRRRDRPRSITLPRIIKVMTWSVLFFSIPLQLEKVADGHTQDITVDDDPNFDPTAPVLEDESPYPEVRSVVANTDDPTMPSSTIRAWVVGLICAVIIPGANQFFSFRYPIVDINQVCEGFPHAAASANLPFGVPVAKFEIRFTSPYC
jgi:hypothetical protein